MPEILQSIESCTPRCVRLRSTIDEVFPQGVEREEILGKHDPITWNLVGMMVMAMLFDLAHED